MRKEIGEGWVEEAREYLEQVVRRGIGGGGVEGVEGERERERVDECGRALLEVACKYANTQLISMILSNPTIDVNRGYEFESPLSIACQYGHLEVVRMFVESKRKDIDIDRVDRHGKTPFYIACANGHLEIVKLLMKDEKVSLNVKHPTTSTTPTPLYVACECGFTDIVKELLNFSSHIQRLDPNEGNGNSATPLFIACQQGYLDIVKLLMNDERVEVNRTQNQGASPFVIACEENNLEVVKYLFNDERVDVNQQKNDGSSPFWQACWKGSVNVVKYLLSQGSDSELDVGNKSNLDSPRTYQEPSNFNQSNQLNNKRRLLEEETKALYSKKKIRREEEESRYGNEIPKFVKKNTQKKLDVTLKNKNDATPLYVACQNGHLEIVELLLKDDRTELNQPRDSGATPFFISCQKGFLDIVKLLAKDQRIDLNSPRNGGETPFFIACQEGQTEIVKFLIKQGNIDYNLPQNEGATPFFISCQQGHLDIVKLLLKDERVDIEKSMNSGASPLFVACQNGYLEIAKWILVNETKNGNHKHVNIEAKFENGRDAIEQAKLFKKYEIVEALETFQNDPLRTSINFRKDLGILEKRASKIFILVVLYCDEYLKIRIDEKHQCLENFIRFLEISKKLPQELQMTLSFNVNYLPGGIIPSKKTCPLFTKFFQN